MMTIASSSTVGRFTVPLSQRLSFNIIFFQLFGNLGREAALSANKKKIKESLWD